MRIRKRAEPPVLKKGNILKARVGGFLVRHAGKFQSGTHKD
jgi:hypothetical protein